ncbi:MAG: hypothetical protein H0V29_04160 [Thermoleophilaceae bacterium]|nr:hypothetical protein [Thermoleophilaceae bacterium]
MTGDPDPETQELKIRQADREKEERERPEEANQRRADKAEYLKKKLEEREQAERQD